MYDMPRTSLQDFLVDILYIFNDVVIPLIFAIAIVAFMWNAVRFFILKGKDEAGQESAKRLALYGIMALVAMLVLWGIVRMAVSAIGANRSAAPCPDFNPNCYSSGSAAGFNEDGTMRVFDLLEPEKGIQSRDATLR